MKTRLLCNTLFGFCEMASQYIFALPEEDLENILEIGKRGRF